MTINYNEDKWDVFETSGRISDYLAYKGILLSNSKGDNQVADGNSQGTCDIRA